MGSDPKRRPPLAGMMRWMPLLTLVIVLVFAIWPAARKLNRLQRVREEGSRQVERAMEELNRNQHALDSAFSRLLAARKLRQEHPEQAVKEYEGILADLGRLGPGGRPLYDQCAKDLADLYVQTGQSEKAALLRERIQTASPRSDAP